MKNVSNNSDGQGKGESSTPEQLLTRKQVAPMFGYTCTESVKRLEKRGLLPAVKLTQRTTRYRLKDVQRVIAQALA